jgi:polyisoprenoid-binding protein YceI
MSRYDANNADCFVFTFKEGLLSSVAHDLRLRVTQFLVEVDDGGSSVVASFDTSSLRVDTPMQDGAENPGALSAADRDKIASQIRLDVLHSARHPTAEFRSASLTARADGGYDVSGALTLHGVTKSLVAYSRLVLGRQELELSLHQPDFGIAPYRAMLGTLKIRADVTIRLVL